MSRLLFNLALVLCAVQLKLQASSEEKTTGLAEPTDLAETTDLSEGADLANLAAWVKQNNPEGITLGEMLGMYKDKSHPMENAMETAEEREERSIHAFMFHRPKGRKHPHLRRPPITGEQLDRIFAEIFAFQQRRKNIAFQKIENAVDEEQKKEKLSEQPAKLAKLHENVPSDIKDYYLNK